MKALVSALLLTLAPAGASLAGQASKAGVAPLSAEEAAHLTYMRQEEKMARDLYIVFNNRWAKPVFANISEREATHFSVLGDALAAALKVGGLVEEADIRDLDTAIAAARHADLAQTYGRLQRASRNHLRAFARNLANQGVTYVAHALSQARVDAILALANERRGMP